MKLPEPDLFLVCYDYGMGGLWWLVRAPDRAAILARRSDLHVLDERPPWIRGEYWARVLDNVQDLGNVTDPILLEILDGKD